MKQKSHSESKLIFFFFFAYRIPQKRKEDLRYYFRFKLVFCVYVSMPWKLEQFVSLFIFGWGGCVQELFAKDFFFSKNFVTQKKNNWFVWF